MDLRHCTLCPRECGADRSAGIGFCGANEEVRIGRAALHFGEEPCITGKNGSGTVFFSGCALRCKFCQNDPISQNGVGQTVSIRRLSEIFLELQQQGAENINLVTPSHYAPMIADSLKLVKEQLNIPVVCNCSGYESAEILKYFDGLIDVYLPDLKYYSTELSARYSAAEDYFKVASSALMEMYRQVGPCKYSSKGTLQKGLLIRHLVLPGGKEDSKKLIQWISENFQKENIRISLMRQYTPRGDLSGCPEINRKLFSMEYTSVLRFASKLELLGYMQGRNCDNFSMTPEFDFSGVLPKGMR